MGKITVQERGLASPHSSVAQGASGSSSGIVIPEGSEKKKIAIILFNLGGPEKPESVKPFLFNLFHDKAIIGLPQPLRYFLARLISSRREEEARKIYAYLGGGSPILANTQAQAQALENLLKGKESDPAGEPSLVVHSALGSSSGSGNPEGNDYKVFIVMRYWHPFSGETARNVRAYDPDEIVLLPLYPQFSTTTTGSSFPDWHRAAKKAGLNKPTRSIESYPAQAGFIAAQAELLRAGYAEAAKHGTPRILFSAHGLPEKIVNAGDPYPVQVKQTVEAIMEKVSGFRFQVSGSGENTETRNLKPETSLCYQSRVGPLKWIGPATDEEIIRAGKDKVPLVIVPVAFTSEHSETLVELDIQYRELAEKSGVPAYVRVPAVGTHPRFIAGLAELVTSASAGASVG